MKIENYHILQFLEIEKVAPLPLALPIILLDKCIFLETDVFINQYIKIDTEDSIFFGKIIKITKSHVEVQIEHETKKKNLQKS